MTAALPPYQLTELAAGTILAAGYGYSTVLPDMDFETYSPAGFVWDGVAGKWRAPEGCQPKDKGLSGVGTAVYTEHPDAEVLSLAYDLKDGRGRRVWMPDLPLPLDLFAYLATWRPTATPSYREPGIIEAWNSGFEFWVWSNICVRRYGFPALDRRQLRCAMAKARAWALPGKLEKAGEVLDLATKKDADGKRLLDKFSIPRNPTKKDPRLRITPAEDPEDAAKLYAYNLTDIVTEAEASARIPDLPPSELEFWLADQAINHRGVAVDMVGVRACISIVQQASERYNGELRQLTGGVVTKASEVQALRGWLAALGCYTDSLDEDAVDGLLKNRAQYDPRAVRALELRKAVGSASVKKVFAMLNRASAAQRLHDMFLYHAARTGRATGAGPQPQNLPNSGPDVKFCARGDCGAWYVAKLNACPVCGMPHRLELDPISQKVRPEVHEWNPDAMEYALHVIGLGSLDYVEHVFGDALATVSACLRGLFVAADGYDLICADYSAIEAVVLAMLAGEAWREDVFRTHGKIYEASAAAAFKVPLDEILDYKKKTGGHHPLRKKGKVNELALGYGGWINALRAFGAPGEDKELKADVLAWRAASPAIVEFWGGQFRGKPWEPDYRPELYGLEGCAIAAVLEPGKAFEHRGIVYQMGGDALYCRLPSGRLLTYHRPRLAPSDRGGLSLSYEGWNTNPVNGPVGAWIRMFTHGGKLTENVVQAVARDLLAFAIVNLEKAGYAVVLHVHDEIVAEVPQGWGSVDEFERIMGTLPDWAAGWPVKTGGAWRGRRYRK